MRYDKIKNGGEAVFGYVRPSVSELRVREHEYYKGTYCGICHAMGSCTGQCSRMTLSYDMVLLALVRLAMHGEKPNFLQKRCIAHPFKKRNVMKKNDSLDFCVCASALLTYHKVLDDIADSRAIKRFFIRLFILPSAARMRKKALGRAPEYAALDAICREKLAELSVLERERCESADLTGALFGEILGEFLAFSLEGDTRRIALATGKSLGKWIYIADALDDIDDDIKTGNYNPFVALYGGKKPSQKQAEDIAVALKNELFCATSALDLLDFGENTTAREIIYNILYLGMPERIEKIILALGDSDRKDN